MTPSNLEAPLWEDWMRKAHGHLRPPDLQRAG